MKTEIEFVANLPESAKEAFVGAMSRSYLIETLIQNDPNGIMKDSNKFLDIDKLELIFNKLENTDSAGQVRIINRLNHAGLTDCLNYFRSGNYSFNHPYNDYETEELREYFFETLQGRT